MLKEPAQFEHPAECNSAVRQITNLRYLGCGFAALCSLRSFAAIIFGCGFAALGNPWFQSNSYAFRRFRAAGMLKHELQPLAFAKEKTLPPEGRSSPNLPVE